MQINVPKQVLRVAMLSEPENEKLGNINVQRDENGKLFARASDGRAAIRVQFVDPDADVLPGLRTGDTAGHILVPAGVADAARKAAVGDNVLIEAIPGDDDKPGRVKLLSNADDGKLVALIECDSPAAEFPPLDEVIETARTEPGVDVRFDPRRMIDLLKTIVETADPEGVVMHHGGESKSPIYFTAGAAGEVVGLLMPLKTDAERKAESREKGWRGTGLDELGLSEKMTAKLVEAGISTLGDLADQPEGGLAKLRGIGKASAEKIQAACAAWWAKHPEMAKE